MNAQEIFDLARQYGAEHPGITFDLAALLRYTRKVQAMEREACAKVCGELADNPENSEQYRMGANWARERIRARSNP